MHLVTMAALLSTLSGAGAAPPATVAPSSAPRTVFQLIDDQYRAGQIDQATRHYYRVAAVREPALLPGPLYDAVGLEPIPSGTRYLVDAFQWVARTGAYGSDAYALLQPPEDEAYVVESTKWPIRVSYPDVSQQAYAEMVLQAAELAYDTQVVLWGFYQPIMEPGYEPYRVSLGDTGAGVAGYTAPYEENFDTPRADCFTYIVINPNLGSGARATTAHEFNHAMQASMDCAEVTTYWENTSTYIESWTVPDSEGSNWYMMQYFQREPWNALDWFDQGGGYQYGGVLWNYFLAHAMNAADGPVMVRQIWEACMQDGFNNEPDYYDAAETVAAARGLDATSMESLYTDFAEARYFVSSNDDGQHLERAAEFPSAEVAVVARHEAELLPVRAGSPSAGQLPEPYGANYIELSIPPGWTRPILVGFDGESSTRWAVRVLRVGKEQTTLGQTVSLDANNDGTLTVDPSGFDKLVLVVANLGKEDYDPDDQYWPRGEYTYRLEAVVDPPVVEAIYPAAVTRGQQNLRVRLKGSGFVYGREFDIRFTDPLLQVDSIDSVSDTEVMFTLTVPASTNVGLHNVTVVNAGGSTVTREKLLAVVETLGAPDPLPEPGGCQTADPRPGPVSLLLVLLGLALVWRRRR